MINYQSTLLDLITCIVARGIGILSMTILKLLHVKKLDCVCVCVCTLVTGWSTYCRKGYTFNLFILIVVILAYNYSHKIYNLKHLAEKQTLSRGNTCHHGSSTPMLDIQMATLPSGLKTGTGWLYCHHYPGTNRLTKERAQDPHAPRVSTHIKKMMESVLILANYNIAEFVRWLAPLAIR